MGRNLPRSGIVTGVGGHAAEQIIAGVVLSERLAVTPYGAIHRAQWSGQRNMRALVVDTRLLDDASFRIALTDADGIERAIDLDRRTIVPTIAVESNGPDVVLVTRGGGRYVTAQDLIAAARANRSAGGKLPLPVAAAIGKSVVEALSTAHASGVVHGAVHPRSVLIDEDGGVRLGDFVVGRALATAVAQGAEAALWRGLVGYIAPELVVGEEPSAQCDVFAAGALLFTMLSGDVPPGTLHVSPAVERLVQRALDTDLVRRYKHASDLLENLLEAFEDDRWEIADRGEIIRAAGLSHTSDNIDDATEDLLASLGNSAVQVTPMRPSIDSRAEAMAARHQQTPSSVNRLAALLADLNDDPRDITDAEGAPFTRDPISELIQHDPRRREAIVQLKPRVPSLDDPDDDTPLPPPRADSDADHSRSRDEAAAMTALRDLDGPVRRVVDAADQAANAAAKLEQAAARAEAAAARVDGAESIDEPPAPPRRLARRSTPVSGAAPIIVEDIPAFDVPPPRLKSRVFGVVLMLVLVGAGVGFYLVYRSQQQTRAKDDELTAVKARDAEAKTKQAIEGLADAGAIAVTSTPSEAGVWLRLGRTPVTTLRLGASSTHELAFVLDGYQLGEAQVLAGNWSGEGAKLAAVAQATLKKLEPVPASAGKDKRPRLVPAALPLQPTAVHATTAAKGAGPITVQSSPPGAEAYLYVGLTGSMRFDQLVAGRDYEFVVVKDGFKPHHLTVKADDWRDGGDPAMPLDSAKKKALLERAVQLEPLTDKGP